MAFGILATGPGRAYRDGVLGAAMASGPGAVYRDGVLGAAMASGPGRAYRDGVLGEFFAAPVSGLGSTCGTCGTAGLGDGDSIGIPTSMIIGVAIGAGLMYLGGCALAQKT